MKSIRRWIRHARFRRIVAPTMSHEDSAQLMRSLAYGGSRDYRTMAALARRALETATDETRDRHALEKWLAMHEAGRPVKVSTHPVIVLEPVNDDLVHAVEEAFEGADREDGS
jgi:hypothetical protein